MASHSARSGVAALWVLAVLFALAGFAAAWRAWNLFAAGGLSARTAVWVAATVGFISLTWRYARAAQRAGAAGDGPPA